MVAIIKKGNYEKLTPKQVKEIRNLGFVALEKFIVKEFKLKSLADFPREGFNDLLEMIDQAKRDLDQLEIE